jgi:hypothetical protein
MRLAKGNSRILLRIWLSALLAAALCTCASKSGFNAADIQSFEDSIVVGRISIRPGQGCMKLLTLPRMELRNTVRRISTPYEIGDLTISDPDERLELPFVQKVIPGTHDLRIKVVEGSWDPTWLDAGMLTLVRFDVPKGFLVYFGTIEIEMACEKFGKHGEARYIGHTISDEHDFELNLFKQEYPEVYQMYKNRIIQSVPEDPWKQS